MNTTIGKWIRWMIFAVLLLGLLGLAPLLGQGTAAAAPAGAVLPPTTCILTGPAERTCELWARAGSVTMPDGVVVPIWGYSDSPAGAAQLPGPALIAEQGETLVVVLHNDLAEPTALAFPGQGLVPDLVGVGPGGTTTYTFFLAGPGTFLYEAGLTASGARQVAMGLFGALIVRPAGNPTWAYNDPNTAFDDEALLVLSEIDPALNADPAGFDMVDFAPQYWLLNGQAYPDTAPIPTDVGRRVLLRQLNAGLEHRSLGLLGLHQAVLGRDGRLLPFYSVVAETIAAGQSLDTLVTVPPAAAPGMRYPLYETSGRVHNSGQLGPGNAVAFGGLLTFLETPAAPPGPDLLGPLVSDAMVMPHVTAGTAGVTLTAMLSEMDTGGADIVAAEYFTDTVGAPGTGVALAVSPAMMVTVTTHIQPAALTGLEHGEYTYYLRGQDALGNWGPVGSASFHLVTAGPMITGQYLTPNPTNGTAAVGIQATADARPSGPASVVAAEYSIDMMAMPGMGTPMSLNQIAPVASLTATIPLSDIAALPEGPHAIYVGALDSLGNWGMPSTVTLILDRSGPLAGSVVVWPAPNNGYRPLLPSLLVVRLEALLSDPLVAGVNSTLERAEGFIDTVGPDDSGFPLMAKDGLWDEMSELGYAHIPLPTIRQLAPGAHTLYVHGKDRAGNWGPVGSVVLVVDKDGPAISGLMAQPNPTNGATGVKLSATATDPANPGGADASNIVAAEWFVGADPGLGMGTAMSAIDGAFDSPSEALVTVINIAGWPPGEYLISVRARDEAGNWGAVSTVILNARQIRPRPLFADNFQSGNLEAWTAVVGPVSVVPEAGMGNTTLGLAAAVSGDNPAYVVDGSPDFDALYSARFYFHPNGTDTAGGSQDIFVALDGGTPAFGLQYEHSAGGGYEVRGWVRHSGVQVYTGWTEISNAPHLLEVNWVSGSATLFVVGVDGQPQQWLENVDTSAHAVDEVWLGPSGGLLDGASGTEYLDEFVSMRAAQVLFDVYLPLISR